jgi:hypothetical protein
VTASPEPRVNADPISARSRIRNMGFALAVLCGTVAGTLIAAEIAVRIVAPQQLILVRPDVWMPLDTLGWVRQPNLATTINTGEKTTSVFTDSLGHRVGSGGPVTAAKRVLLLGDSFVEALSVEHEESLAGQLELLLPDLVGAPVAVHNTGVGGWEPSHYLLQAVRSLERERYDLVLTAVYVGNDVVSSRTDRFPPLAPVGDTRVRIPRHLAWSELVDAIAYPVNQYLEERSHFFVLLKTRASTLRMRLGLSRVYLPTEHLRSERESARWDTTAAILSDIASMAAANETPAVFVLLPSNFQVHREILNTYVTGFGLDTALIDVPQPNELLLDRMRGRGLETLDPLDHLHALAGDGTRLFGAVDTHLNEAGNGALASWLAPQIAPHLRPLKRD